MADTSTPDPASLEARLTDLEIQSAHQDQVIEDLNTTITDQWKELDRLRRLVEKMAAMLEDLEADRPPPANRKPPHY